MLLKVKGTNVWTLITMTPKPALFASLAPLSLDLFSRLEPERKQSKGREWIRDIALDILAVLVL